MLVVEILSDAGCAVNCLFHASTIFRMNALKNHFGSDRTRLVVSKNSEVFPGTDALAGGDIPDEAAGLAHPLCLDQFGFASPQFVLGPLAILDVGGRPVPFDNVALLVAQRHGSKQKPAIFTIEAPQLGKLVNRMRGSDECEPWTFGVGALMRNLAKRKLL